MNREVIKFKGLFNRVVIEITVYRTMSKVVIAHSVKLNLESMEKILKEIKKLKNICEYEIKFVDLS
jgi:hypothetical protein